jgi:3-deoxy-D-manno-octulosonic-acid transferase
MSLILYSIGLQMMEWLAWLISPFNLKVKAFVKGRKQALIYLKKNIIAGQEKILWVHASSVGEYEQGRPVMEMFKANFPEFKILVSFYSPSGYEAVETDEIVDYKCYLPLDSRKNAQQIIALVKPKIVFFIKYEFWHYYLDELSKNSIPIFSVSSIFRPQQVFFRWSGGFFRQMLMKFDYFFVQDQASMDLLNSINIKSSISGDTRIDRVLTISKKAAAFPEIETFIDNQPVFVIGSLRKEDIAIVSQLIRQTPEYKFLVAPHEITDEMMRPLEIEFDTTRYTELIQDSMKAQVLIIDTIGMLSKIYRYGQYAYVGGGFSDGIHNILEPAAYKIPVFFGNLDYTRFKEAIDLTTLGVAFAVGTAEEMKKTHESIASNPARRRQIEEGIAAYLNLNKGASEKIIEHLYTFIS